MDFPVIWEKVMLTEEIINICSSGIGPDQKQWKKTSTLVDIF
jgi:hypothetical protein